LKVKSSKKTLEEVPIYPLVFIQQRLLPSLVPVIINLGSIHLAIIGYPVVHR
jgi:hypothetical protein